MNSHRFLFALQQYLLVCTIMVNRVQMMCVLYV